jgi:hypothetical protein
MNADKARYTEKYAEILPASAFGLKESVVAELVMQKGLIYMVDIPEIKYHK